MKLSKDPCRASTEGRACGGRPTFNDRCYIHERWPESAMVPREEPRHDARQKPREPARPAPEKPAPPTLLKLSDSFPRAIERGRLRAKGLERPVASPWADLNDTLGGGFWAGLHMLVAGTGVGKTQLCLQIALNAATDAHPIPVGLIELELDEMQLALRILGENADVGWSKAYLGKSTDEQYAKLDEASARLSKIPIYTDFGDAMSWGPSRLRSMAESMRKTHPHGPLLIVLDFLQLVGPDAGDDSRLDLRERIGRAAYQARMVARQLGVSVIIVSSTARDNYGALSAKMEKTGLRVQQGQFGTNRVVTNPDALIGTGKESGELEYAADTVTVLVRPQLKMGAYDPVIDEIHRANGSVVVAATVKVRAGHRGWFALSFVQGRFKALPGAVSNSLAGVKEEDAPIDTDPQKALAARLQDVVDAVTYGCLRKMPVRSKTDLYALLQGTKAYRIESVRLALRAGLICTDPITKEYRPSDLGNLTGESASR